MAVVYLGFCLKVHGERGKELHHIIFHLGLQTASLMIQLKGQGLSWGGVCFPPKVHVPHPPTPKKKKILYTASQEK